MKNRNKIVVTIVCVLALTSTVVFAGTSFDDLWNQNESDNREESTYVEPTPDDVAYWKGKQKDSEEEKEDFVASAAEWEQEDPVITYISATKSSIKLKWKKNATHFFIELHKGNQKVREINEYKGTSYTFKHLSPGAKYKVVLRSFTRKADSDYYAGNPAVKSISTQKDPNPRIYNTEAEAREALWKAIKRHDKTFTFYVKGYVSYGGDVGIDKVLNEKRWGDYRRTIMSYRIYCNPNRLNSKEKITINGIKCTYYRYDFTYYLTLDQERAFLKKADKKLKSMKLKGSSYEKASKIARYVNKTKSISETKKIKNIDKTAYAALYKRKSTCQGKAALFYVMCRKEGIPVRIVEGFFHSGKMEDHKLNIVKAGKKWRFVDCQISADFVKAGNKKFFSSKKRVFQPFMTSDIIKKYKPVGYKNVNYY